MPNKLPEAPVKALFTDVGGVILTNGWDRGSRQRASDQFGLDLAEMNQRHHLTFDTFEIGKLTLDVYLDRIVFYEPRTFSKDEFKAFVYAQSQPYPEMLDLIRETKKRNSLKLAVVSNEGRELTEYRIRKFGLADFVDFFVSSCFVHFRKPDTEIFRMAIDMAQTPPDQTVYLDDRHLFVEVAQSVGLNAIHHTSCAETKQAFAKLGLA